MFDFGWLLPCPNRITSGWNLSRVDPVNPSHGVQAHFGWDFGCPIGTPLHAPFDGVVEHWWPVGALAPAGFTSPRPLNGNCLILRPNDAPMPAGWQGAPMTAFEMFWLHLSASSVHVGDRFKRGDLLAHSGNTGYVAPPPTPEHPDWGAHLHMELHVNGQPLDASLVYGGRLKLS